MHSPTGHELRPEASFYDDPTDLPEKDIRRYQKEPDLDWNLRRPIMGRTLMRNGCNRSCILLRKSFCSPGGPLYGGDWFFFLRIILGLHISGEG